MITTTIDGGCFAGHDTETGFTYPVDALLRDFDRIGISSGLVSSYRSIYYDIWEGNREAARWADKAGGRLLPLGVVNPCQYGHPPEKILAWLKQELKCPAVSVLNIARESAIDWESPAVRAIGEAAERLKIPLQAGIQSERELAGVERSWGSLNIPVLIRWMAGHRYKSIASELAVAHSCANFLFDVGNLSSNGSLEFMADQIGTNRLFWASNAPHNIPDCPAAMLKEADLAASQRMEIGCGTLSTALGLDSLTPSLACREDVASWERILNTPKVDIHWHPDHWNLGEPHLADEDQIATFDRYAYQKVILFSILGLTYDFQAGNRQSETWFEKDPRVFGLVVVNPKHPRESIQEIYRRSKHPRFVGIKTIQDVFGLTLDDPEYGPILDAAADVNLPILAHLPGLGRSAQRYPEVTFVAAHSNWGRAQNLIPLKNVCFDFSTGHALRHESQLRRFIDSVGPRRVLFGSDGQVVAPQWSLAKLKSANLPPEEESLILRENAYRIFPKLRAIGRSKSACLHPGLLSSS